jgi:hypothetical protein
MINLSVPLSDGERGEWRTMGWERSRPSELGRRNRSDDPSVLVKTAGKHVLRFLSHSAGLDCLQEGALLMWR